MAVRSHVRRDEGEDKERERELLTPEILSLQATAPREVKGRRGRLRL